MLCHLANRKSKVWVPGEISVGYSPGRMTVGLDCGTDGQFTGEIIKSF
jgi:hypothetical protein